ncbi:MAG: hypothetical protein R3C14_02855 [Caldilineaceae bacterium]
MARRGFDDQCNFVELIAGDAQTKIGLLIDHLEKLPAAVKLREV